MTLSGQQVFVTGATGFLGGALALRLADDGAHVRALARSAAKAELLRARGIEIVIGDVTDANTIMQAVAGCAYVFHVAAAFRGWAEQQAVNVEGTRAVARAAAAAGVQRLIHVSTIGVYGTAQPGDVTEDMQPAPGISPYAVTKNQGEAVVRGVCAEHNLSYAINRPAFIYGPRSQPWTGGLFRLARLNPTPWFGDGSGSSHPIHVDDVVDQLVVLATHPAAHNQTFNCSPDPAPTWREFLGLYARLAGHNNWLALPPMLGYALAGIAMLASPPAHEARALPDFFNWTQQHQTIKMTKSQELLGWSPRIALADGVAGCAPWLREQGWLRD
ncbi:MAG: NAD-dependent epimerase/dehydratase family protein [Chloroflexi bacterium]|nr:NAD-dependent epimerase/dehydratase family protein [Chloroflexota bacterium]